MAHFWMDISRDDDGTVMSVVAGCDACGIRTAGNDYDETKQWISRHAIQFHAEGESRAIRQIGEAAKINRKAYKPATVRVQPTTYAKTTFAQDAAEDAMEAHGALDTQAFADLMDYKFNSAFKLLDRMAKEGRISKTKQGRKVLWQALEAGTEAPEAEIAVAVAPELIKPVERLTRPYYGNPRVLQGFSDNAEVYGRFGFRGHMGLDIGIAMQPVLAAHDGIVEFAGDGGEWPLMGAAAGTCILLKGEGFRTGYAHLSRTYVNIGASVKAGDVIGISGDTGATTGFHLHFEVMPMPHNHNNGYAGRVDPTPYLVGAA